MGLDESNISVKENLIRVLEHDRPDHVPFYGEGAIVPKFGWNGKYNLEKLLPILVQGCGNANQILDEVLITQQAFGETADIQWLLFLIPMTVWSSGLAGFCKFVSKIVEVTHDKFYVTLVSQIGDEHEFCRQCLEITS